MTEKPVALPSPEICASDEIQLRNEMLEHWCDSWNEKMPEEKRAKLMEDLFDQTNDILVREWPPVEKFCRQCHAAYARGLQKAGEMTGEYLDRSGAPPANGRGLYLRLGELLKAFKPGGALAELESQLTQAREELKQSNFANTVAAEEITRLRSELKQAKKDKP